MRRGVVVSRFGNCRHDLLSATVVGKHTRGSFSGDWDYKGLVFESFLCIIECVVSITASRRTGFTLRLRLTIILLFLLIIYANANIFALEWGARTPKGFIIVESSLHNANLLHFLTGFMHLLLLELKLRALCDVSARPCRLKLTLSDMEVLNRWLTTFLVQNQIV